MGIKYLMGSKMVGNVGFEGAVAMAGGVVSLRGRWASVGSGVSATNRDGERVCIRLSG